VDVGISLDSPIPDNQCLLTCPAPLTSCWIVGSPTYSTEPTPLISASSFSLALTMAEPAPATSILTSLLSRFSAGRYRFPRCLSPARRPYHLSLRYLHRLW
jgi:hypothetical protein